MKRPLNPHDLATIKTPHSTRRRVVEVISRQTPKATIMVRMTPGDPTTLREVSVWDLIPYPKSRYIHVAKVSSKFPFPEDMLRYDSAFLLDPDQDEEPVDEMGRHTFRSTEPILIYSVSSRKTPPWTVARWHSFCCGIEPYRCFDLWQEPFVEATA